MLLTSVPFIPWQSGLPFPRYNLTSKIQGQRYPSQCSVQLTHFLSVSHQGIPSTPIPLVPWQSGLPFPRYNLTLKIPWKFKVRGTPVSPACSLLISVVFHISASYRLQSLSFHDNQATHSLDTILKVKGQGQMYHSQRSIQLTHFLFISHQLDQPVPILHVLRQIPIKFLTIAMNFIEWLASDWSFCQPILSRFRKKYIEIITHITMDFSQ